MVLILPSSPGAVPQHTDKLTTAVVAMVLASDFPPKVNRLLMSPSIQLPC